MAASLARDEVELINPKVGRAAFELLRMFHSREWTDRQGWHVVISASRLAEVEACERAARAAGK